MYYFNNFVTKRTSETPRDINFHLVSRYSFPLRTVRKKRRSTLYCDELRANCPYELAQWFSLGDFIYLMSDHLPTSLFSSKRSP